MYVQKCEILPRVQQSNAMSPPWEPMIAVVDTHISYLHIQNTVSSWQNILRLYVLCKYGTYEKSIIFPRFWDDFSPQLETDEREIPIKLSLELHFNMADTIRLLLLLWTIELTANNKLLALI